MYMIFKPDVNNTFTNVYIKNQTCISHRFEDALGFVTSRKMLYIYITLYTFTKQEEHNTREKIKH